MSTEQMQPRRNWLLVTFGSVLFVAALLWFAGDYYNLFGTTVLAGNNETEPAVEDAEVISQAFEKLVYLPYHSYVSQRSYNNDTSEEVTFSEDSFTPKQCPMRRGKSLAYNTVDGCI